MIKSQAETPLEAKTRKHILHHFGRSNAVEQREPPTQRLPLLRDGRLLRSYNHLLLTPKLPLFPPAGEGVAGITIDSLKEEPRLSGEDEPKLCLRTFSLPPFATILCNSGLGEGEKGVPDENRRLEALALVDNGEPEWLAGLAVLDPEDTRYFGGVTYDVVGAEEDVVDGSSPRRVRCVGVRGMSDILSFGRKRGYNATSMLRRKINCMISSDKSAYVGISVFVWIQRELWPRPSQVN